MSLNFTDLELMERLITVCQARGAFRMEEMLNITQLYGKILQLISQEKGRQESSLKSDQRLLSILDERKG
jgi:hypothetical protein